MIVVPTMAGGLGAVVNREEELSKLGIERKSAGHNFLFSGDW